MKKVLFLALILTAITGIAQVPEGVSYQAVAFNTNGAPVTNSNVGIKISVLDNSATGTVVYTETHSKPTNAQGLFNLNVGQGTPTNGTFSGVNWGTNPKFLKVEIDPTGGTNYTNVGVNQLMSVPYALYAKETPLTNSLTTNGTGAFKDANFVVMDEHTIYAFENGTWYPQTCTSIPAPSEVIASNGRFVVLDEHNIYAFENGTWYLQTCTSIPASSEAIASNGRFVVMDEHNIYAFENGTWYLQTCTSIPAPSEVIASNGRFVVLDEHNIYAFENGTWYLQTCTSIPATTELIASPID